EARLPDRRGVRRLDRSSRAAIPALGPGERAEMLGQAEVLAVVDRDLEEGRAVDVEGAAEGRQQVRRRRRSEPRDAERLGIGDEVRIAEIHPDRCTDLVDVSLIA